MSAGLGRPLSQGRNEAFSHSESQPLPCEVEDVSSEAKWVFRRSWFWVAIVRVKVSGEDLEWVC